MSVALRPKRSRPNDKGDIRPFAVAAGRQQDRVPYTMKVEIKGRMSAGVHETLDISYNGCFVITPTPAGANQLVQLMAYLPHGDRVDFVGRVAFVVEAPEASEEKPAGMGLEIFAIDRKAAPQWERFVDGAFAEAAKEAAKAMAKAEAKAKATAAPEVAPPEAQPALPAGARPLPPEARDRQPPVEAKRDHQPSVEAEREGRRRRRTGTSRVALCPTELRRLVRALGNRDGESLLRIDRVCGVRAEDHVDLVCEHPASFESIELSAQVVRVEADGTWFHLAELSDEERRALIHFLVTGRVGEARRLERRPLRRRPGPVS